MLEKFRANALKVIPQYCIAHPYYKLIAILRRQYHIILTASWEKIYFLPTPSIKCGIAVSKSQLVLYRDPSFIRINETVN